MNTLSLFSGIGGLDLGLQRAGMQIVGHVEIDSYCRRVLARHWPEVPQHDDVNTANEWWGSQSRPSVDLVAGGFPCQPVSSSGLRRGQLDPRWLWPGMFGIVRRLRPRFVVMENVVQLLRTGLADVLGDLASIGYDAEWDCLPASAIGALHSRDRWFAVAYPSRQRNADKSASGDRSALPVWAVSGPGDRADVRGNASGDQQPGRGPGVLAAVLEAPRVLGSSRPVHVGDWGHEPGVPRMAHGVPGRLDTARRHALGNAVVPQVGEHIGALVMDAEQRLERAA